MRVEGCRLECEWVQRLRQRRKASVTTALSTVLSTVLSTALSTALSTVGDLERLGEGTSEGKGKQKENQTYQKDEKEMKRGRRAVRWDSSALLQSKLFVRSH